MAFSLNPDAPLFMPSTRAYDPCPISYTNPNPNHPCSISYTNPNINTSYYLNTYNYLCPYYLEVQQASFFYTYSPAPFMYNYYTVPCYNYIVPTPQHRRCSIAELDEKQETEVDTEVMVASERNQEMVLVHKVRKSASEFSVSRKLGRMHKKLPKFRERNFEINNDGDFDDRTTVMIKNIPPKITKNYLLAMLDDHCYNVNRGLVELQGTNEEIVLSEFDFFYLPIDFSTSGNLGYALVNFTSSIAVKRVHFHFQGYSWGDIGSGKICRVNYAHRQGWDALVKRANDMDLRGKPEEYLPCRFEPARNGQNDFTEHLLGRTIQ